MSNQGRQNRQKNESEKSQKGQNLKRDPEKSLQAILVGYKDTLESLRKLLSSDVDLRKITAPDLNSHENDLRVFINEIEKLSNQPDIAESIKSLDAVKEKVKLARNKLYTALDVLEMGNTIEDRKNLFYPSLTECEQLLSEALEQFLI